MHFNLAGLWISVIFPLNLAAAAPPALPTRLAAAGAGLGAVGTLGSPPQHPWGDTAVARLMSLPRGSLVLSRATKRGHRLRPPLNAEGLGPAPTAPSRGPGPPGVAQGPQGWLRAPRASPRPLTPAWPCPGQQEQSRCPPGAPRPPSPAASQRLWLNRDQKC